MPRHSLLLPVLGILLAIPSLADADPYCQDPYWAGINASSAYDAEIADDIPEALVGETITHIKLYVAEWLGLWQDPESIIVAFYGGVCPPPVSPGISYVIPWGNVESTHFSSSGPMVAYEVTLELPSPLTIDPSTSLGVSLVTPWGQAAPFAGFLLANPDQSVGCGGFYWDYAAGGAPRWTDGSVVPEIDADLAYCLTIAGATAVAEPMVAPATWGHAKSLYR